MSAREFYILSLSHTKRIDGLLTWWGPNNSGYVFRLEWAGRYPENAIEPSYHNDGKRTIAVPCEEVERLAVTAAEARSRSLDRPSPTHPGTDRVVEFRHMRAMRRLAYAGEQRPRTMEAAYAAIPVKGRDLMRRHAARVQP